MEQGFSPGKIDPDYPIARNFFDCSLDYRFI
jgi:hypothetical protein